MADNNQHIIGAVFINYVTQKLLFFRHPERGSEPICSFRTGLSNEKGMGKRIKYKVHESV